MLCVCVCPTQTTVRTPGRNMLTVRFISFSSTEDYFKPQRDKSFCVELEVFRLILMRSWLWHKRCHLFAVWACFWVSNGAICQCTSCSLLPCTVYLLCVCSKKLFSNISGLHFALALISYAGIHFQVCLRSDFLLRAFSFRNYILCRKIRAAEW